jgi:hypothetical protein
MTSEIDDPNFGILALEAAHKRQPDRKRFDRVLDVVQDAVLARSAPYRQEAKHQTRIRNGRGQIHNRGVSISRIVLLSANGDMGMMSMTIHHTLYDERPKNAAHHHYARRRSDG